MLYMDETDLILHVLVVRASLQLHSEVGCFQTTCAKRGLRRQSSVVCYSEVEFPIRAFVASRRQCNARTYRGMNRRGRKGYVGQGDPKGFGRPARVRDRF